MRFRPALPATQAPARSQRSFAAWFSWASGLHRRKYLKGSFTVFKGSDDYEVVVDFDAWATDLVRGRTWHASQEFTELPDGCSRLRFRLNNIEEMERWILS